MAIIHIENDQMFAAEVLQSAQPVLVDFWASWCGPCRMMAPVLEELAAAYPDVKVAKVDVDQVQQPAIQLGIDSIPAFLLFENGKVKARTVGAMPIQALVRELGL